MAVQGGNMAVPGGFKMIGGGYMHGVGSKVLLYSL